MLIAVISDDSDVRIVVVNDVGIVVVVIVVIALIIAARFKRRNGCFVPFGFIVMGPSLESDKQKHRKTLQRVFGGWCCVPQVFFFLILPQVPTGTPHHPVGNWYHPGPPVKIHKMHCQVRLRLTHGFQDGMLYWGIRGEEVSVSDTLSGKFKSIPAKHPDS